MLSQHAEPSGSAVSFGHHQWNHFDFLLMTILHLEPTVCKGTIGISLRHAIRHAQTCGDLVES